MTAQCPLAWQIEKFTAFAGSKPALILHHFANKVIATELHLSTPSKVKYYWFAPRTTSSIELR